MRLNLIAMLLLPAAAAAAAPAPGAVQARPGGVGARTVELPEKGFRFALAADKGALAAIDPAGDSVSLYPQVSAGGTDRRVRQKIGSTPISIVHKRVGPKGYFLVLCSGEQSLYVLDDATLQVQKKLALKGTNPTMVTAASDPAATTALYVGTPPPGFAEGAQAIDLATFTELGPVMGLQLDEVVMSADGLHVYGRRMRSVPSGFSSFRLLPPLAAGQPPRAAQLLYEHHNSSPYVPDTFGQFVAVNQAVYTADLKQQVGKLQVPAVCFWPDRPVLFGVEGGEVVALSSNTYTPVGRVAVPEGFDATTDERMNVPRPGPAPVRPGAAAPAAPRAAPAQAEDIQIGNNRRRYPLVALADPAHSNLLLCRAGKVAVLPLSAFNLPAEPLLYATVEGKTELRVGESAAVTLAPKDPKVSLELREAPAGMKLTGQKLTWVPAETDIGSHKVRVRLFSGNVEREHTVECTVRRPAVDLPFVATELQVSDDGKLAVAMRPGKDDGRDPYPRSEPFGAAPATRLAVIDLEKMAVVAERTVAFKGSGIGVGAGMVFVGVEDSDAFYALSLKDLSEVRRVFTSSRVSTFVSVADKTMYAALGHGQGGQGPVHRYTLPDLKPMDAPRADAATRAHNPFGGTPLPVRVADGWYHEGVLYDGAMVKTRLLVQPAGFFVVATGNVNRGGGLVQMRPGLPVAAYGTEVQNGQIRRLGGQTVGQISGLAYAALADFPAAAVLIKRDGRSNGARGAGAPERRDRAEMVLRDLITGATVESLVLFDEPVVQDFEPRAPDARLVTVPGLVAARLRDRLFVVRTKGLDAKKYPPPLHLVPEQSALLVTTAKPTVLSHTARGGKAPLEFTLGNEMPGLSLDKPTGKLTVDARPFLEKAVEAVLSQLQYQTEPTTGRAIPVEQGMTNLIREVAPRFARAVGRQPAGVPVTLPISVIVRDQEQQTAALDYQVFLEVPQQRVLAKLREVQGAAGVARPAAGVAATRPALPSPSGPASRPAQGRVAGGDDGALRQRIQELERRNQQLEAQVESLVDLLRSRGQQPASRPAQRP